MGLIPRGFFKEGKYKDKEDENNYFTKEIRAKILLLFNDFDLNRLEISSVAFIGGEYENYTLNFLKSKLKYILPTHQINDFDRYFIYCNFNELVSCIELYLESMMEVMQIYDQHHNSRGLMSLSKYDTHKMLAQFLKNFNDLMDYNQIPYNFTYNEILDKIHIENKFNPIEEQTKEIFYEIIKENTFEKVNEYFYDCLDCYTKKDYKNSIENAYLTLEHYLKLLTGNLDKTAIDNFADFQSKEFYGIFNLPELKGKVKNQIACIYAIRSKLKSHSPTEKFNEKEFLKETAKFQINEVMNICILLSEVSKNDI